MEALLISLGLGVMVALAVFSGLRAVAAIPAQDRSYMDRPPLGFRLTWPLISVFAHVANLMLGSTRRQALERRLIHAGVNYAITSEQFFGARLVSVLVMAAFCLFLQHMLDRSAWIYVVAAGLFGFFYPEIWLKEKIEARSKQVFRALPFYLDIITLSVESGSNLTTGLAQAVQKAPEGPLRAELARVLRDMRAGTTRSDALRALTVRVRSEGLNNVVSSIIQAEKTGASLGPVLRAQADQLRSSRFLKAEKMAMEAPVKLLGPLVVFIFPTTFLVIIFVMLSQALAEGVLQMDFLVWAYSNPK